MWQNAEAGISIRWKPYARKIVPSVDECPDGDGN
jgi:hypothetical protein